MTTVSLREAFKIGVNIPVDKQAASEHLMSLYENNNKSLTPEVVVDDAKPEGSIMHNCFEWDNEKAGNEWRLQQARSIIRSITIVRDGESGPKEVRAFVNIRHDQNGTLTHRSYLSKKDGSQSTYIAFDDVMRDENLKKYALDSAYMEIRRWTEKYKDLKELAKLRKEIEKHLPEENK